jgi:beta-glucuronidase
LTNVGHRKTISLNGEWRIIIDPYENGYYNYRYQPRGDGYFENKKPKDKSDLVEYDFDKSETLEVPGDWNTQKEKLFFYEGTIWYEKSFNYIKQNNKRIFLYFGAVNYAAIVYLNGKKLGEHIGGFTPFDFEITNLIKSGNNFVVVKVDNKRLRDGIPTLNTDWWNYGGLTRGVYLIEEPETFIQDYFIQLKKGSMNEINGWAKLDGNSKKQKIVLQIPEAGITKEINSNENGIANLNFKANLKLWSPSNPYLYQVKIICETDTIKDNIGFRSIETKEDKILLNGKPIFLHGIAIHEEAPFRSGRAYSKEDAVTLLSWAKELGCNYVRLAHYPHNENMVREADKLGLLVWSEIPVYWTIQWKNKETLENAENQLTEMITRDKNRASIIIWSMANETPRSDERNAFLETLIDKAKSLDSTRLITAATELNRQGKTMIIDDPLSNYLDVIGINEYIGWYNAKPGEASKFVWENKFNKPVIISELGAAALYGFHGDKDTRWTEEYQANVYQNQIKMLRKIPFLSGMSPWILMDFRSPRRPLPYIQDFWNRKGLISNRGEKKEAFYTLQKFYKEFQSK